MKILYWTPQFWPQIGGIEILAMSTLPPLKERGHQFMIVTSHGSSQQPDSADYQGIPIRRLPFWSSLKTNDVRQILRIQNQAAELRDAFKPDLIHIDFSGYTAFFQVAIAGSYRAPTVLALHNDPTGLKIGPDSTLRRLFDLADWVTGISQCTLAAARAMAPEISTRSSVIYACSEEWDRQPAPLSFDGPCILAIGRLVAEKGMDLLVDAMRRIADTNPKVILRIIGDGPERAALKQRASSLGLQDRVEFAGSVPPRELPEYINQAGVVVIPSRWQEPFGIVAVEAAWMARPVVAADVGGLPEIIVDAETGLLVEKENSVALAEAIVSLLSQPELAERMGRAGRARVQREFSKARRVAAYESLYQSLLRGHVPVA